MPSEGQRTRIAVLIDADNASHRHAGAIFTEIAKIGEAIVRRIYGEFTTPGLRGWSENLAKYALVPVHTIAFTKNKNASDIALVIDAMDLLHTGLYDAFFIISSDSDFTRLAQRLREQGAEVYGVGESKTPTSFRQSCRRFFLVENLARDQAAEAAQEPELGLPETAPLPASEATATIMSAFERHKGDQADGWVPVRTLQKTINNIRPDFDVRSYGEDRLGDLAVKTGAFDVKQIRDKGWWLTAKQPKGGARPPAAKPTGRPVRTDVRAATPAKPKTTPVAAQPTRTSAVSDARPAETIDPDRLPRPLTSTGARTTDGPQTGQTTRTRHDGQPAGRPRNPRKPNGGN